VSLDAVISHDSALALYDVSDRLPAHIHIAVLRSVSRRRPSYRRHTGRITPADIMHYRGLQVTAVARTIAEVALAGLPEESVEQAAREAVAAGPVRPENCSRRPSAADAVKDVRCTLVRVGQLADRALRS